VHARLLPPAVKLPLTTTPATRWFNALLAATVTEACQPPASRDPAPLRAATEMEVTGGG
jgi:hypothetical protein